MTGPAVAWAKRQLWIAAASLLLAAGGGTLAFKAAVAPGAGAAYQQAPERVGPGETVAITLRLAVWGAGGPAGGRYRDVRLLLRQVPEPRWTVLRPLRMREGADGVSYRFEFVAAPGARAISYRFAFTFDNQAKEVAGTHTIAVVPPAAIKRWPRQFSLNRNELLRSRSNFAEWTCAAIWDGAIDRGEVDAIVSGPPAADSNKCWLTGASSWQQEE